MTTVKKELPKEVTDILDKAAKVYSESEATTNAGRWLRFIAKFIQPSIIIKIFAYQRLNKN